MNASLPCGEQTYNVLAQKMVRHHEYTAREATSWSFRRRWIKKEIGFYSPDILALQEVQSHVRRSGACALSRQHACSEL